MPPYAGKYHDELLANAALLGTPGKGIIDAEESTGTISKLSIDVNVGDSQNYTIFELVSDPPDPLKYISGMILDEETLNRENANGKCPVDILNESAVLAGIKADKGTVKLAGTNGETTTAGLDGLAEQCEKYYEAGVRFATWHAVFKIGPNEPSQLAVKENARGLASFAVNCQESGLVPILEPEILVDGVHSIDKCAEVTERVLAACYKALHDRSVLLQGTLLMTNMVTPGSEAPKVIPEVIAECTILSMRETVLAAVPAIIFLSHGQSKSEAVLNLNAMNKPKSKKAKRSSNTTRIVNNPWSLSFSFGQALQQSILNAWAGAEENFDEARATLLKIFKANSEAALGTYRGNPQMDEEAALRTYKGKAKLIEGTSGSRRV
ncbi:hypothetical protein ACJRO7_031361 [Eucalyptus globulus]|uniref:fructose-bisphosphate aldolase n=1 Tax=Eucalyptus globulus TaxID=34317 RepID=A0ABD3JSG7_EUCGL